MRKLMKRGIAMMLTFALMVPYQPAMAALRSSPSVSQASESTENGENEKKATPGNAQKEEPVSEDTEKKESVSEDTAKKDLTSKEESAAENESVPSRQYTHEAMLQNAEEADESNDIIYVYTREGSKIVRTGSEEEFPGSSYEFFEEDGSYTIKLTDKNPFFPYRVRFYDQNKDEDVQKYFMNPDDQVKIGEHTFHISADFDGTAITKINFKIAGNTVPLYLNSEFPEDESEGTEAYSLLPLERGSLRADLSKYTPAELTMVGLEIFAGKERTDSGKVMFRYDDDGNYTNYGDDNYTINVTDDILDLSHDTASGDELHLEMIAGKDSQLAADNIRYTVNLKTAFSGKWLLPTVYTQDAEGKRSEKRVLWDPVDDEEGGNFYQDLKFSQYSDWNERRLDINILSEQLGDTEEAYIQLKINKDIFPGRDFKVYEGSFTSAAEAKSGKEITNQICNSDMTKADAGYLINVDDDTEVTMVMFDAKGQVIGCLPFYLYLESIATADINFSFYKKSGFNQEIENVLNKRRVKMVDGIDYYTLNLYEGYAADQLYYLRLNYNIIDPEGAAILLAAYAGKYSSMKEAVSEGAADIKDVLFGSDGYYKDYSQGIFFTIFVEENGKTKTYQYHFQTEEGVSPPSQKSNNTWITFTNLLDKDGKVIDVINLKDSEDSYADGHYWTMLVQEDVDLTDLKPVFHTADDKMNVYTSKGKEKSGETSHDFSKGPIQYTSSAESGKNARNIWLQVVKAGVSNGSLYINSLGDEAAHTKVEDGVTYSTREVLLDGRYDYQHDLLLVNVGDKAIPNLSVELVSDEVELDPYWTLDGKNELSDVTHNGESTRFSGGSRYQWNLAKLRFRAKEGLSDGRDVSGTLTIKSGDSKLIVLTLTGVIGDPSITIKDIPQAVKYVPYGIMLQNNNKYSWNRPVYSLVKGELPPGMELKENGEIYGVPTEVGEYTFTAHMENSYRDFKGSEKEFTLTVIENTDTNVDGATDQDYMLTQRIQNMELNLVYEQTMISDGIYDEFTYIFLDGVKLEKDVDFTSESGSTRITIRKETLQANNTPGRHTLGIEFRTGDAKVLKRAAQNYYLDGRSNNNNNNNNNNSNNGSHSGGGGGGGRSSSGVSRTNISVPRDPKKGYYNAQTGIITGEGDGYSRWVNDEFGWKLIYADGTPAIGQVTQLADGTAAEQVVWEQINGAWYAFGITGYLKSGWVCDYQLNGWYFMTENGMYSGWYADAQDQCVYYMEPGSGKLATGWRMIDGKWYYFNETSAAPTWNYNAVTGVWVYNPIAGNKPYGAAYINEPTPDGYFVGIDGVWDGQEKE